MKGKKNFKKKEVTIFQKVRKSFAHLLYVNKIILANIQSKNMLKYENYALRHVQRFIQSKHCKHTLHTRIPIILSHVCHQT